MKISVITLFPHLFTPFFTTSILKRAQDKGLVGYETVDLRQFGEGRHQVVDGRPFGGGAGMVLKANTLTLAWQSIIKTGKTLTVFMTASGKKFTQEKAAQLSKIDHIIIVSGHYEGVDQRFIDKYVDSEISIGDFVLTGGEIPALAVIDAAVRLIPGVLEKPEAVEEESFSFFSPDQKPLLEYPQYTRPEVFEGEAVPEVLLSGNHQKIKAWRLEKALEKTKKLRPDLLK